jgi:RNA polymerase sigma factor (sigma-70 family)
MTTASSVSSAENTENKTRAHDDGLSAFMRVRARLFGIAYRMLGSTAEAEDVVQDVWLRWQMVDRSVVRDAAAFLATTTTRLAINVMQSARSRRETSVGPWLPEPVDTNANPALDTELSDALESAAQILLEKLSPAERAAYVLREAFDYPYREIAHVLRLKSASRRPSSAPQCANAKAGSIGGSGAPKKMRRWMAGMIGVRNTIGNSFGSSHCTIG